VVSEASLHEPFFEQHILLVFIVLKSPPLIVRLDNILLQTMACLARQPKKGDSNRTAFCCRGVERFAAMRAGASKLNGAVMRIIRKLLVTCPGPSRRLLGALSISVAVAAALPPAAAFANDQVTLRLDWTFEGEHLPYVWALDQGYYAAEGIDAKILEGRGSGNTAQLVGAKSDTFGEADAARAALARGQGAPLKVVAVFIQRSEGTVVSYASSGLNKPADLIGKKVATSPGSSSTVLFQTMLSASNIPASKIDIINVESTAKTASLLQHRVDAITGLMGDECMLVKQKSPGEKITCMPMADFGVKALGAGLIVNDDTIKQNPDLVRRFVQATAKGWAEAAKDPAKAAAIGKKHFPLADEKTLQAQFETIIPLVYTPNSAGHPIGWMAPADWHDTIDTLRSFMGLTSTAPATDYYTNEFIAAQK
jgi:NitT/TauT family transport system substrate-binding protein